MPQKISATTKITNSKAKTKSSLINQFYSKQTIDLLKVLNKIILFLPSSRRMH